MTLKNLINLEALLLRDEGVDPTVLHQRDRAADLPVAQGRRAALAALAEQAEGPGEAVRRALGWLWAGALLVSANLGWGVGSALLAYDGQTPVNVLDTLLVAVAAQLALFLMGLLPLFGVIRWPTAAGRWPAAAMAQRALGWLLDRFTRPDDGAREKAARASYLLKRTRLRNRRYARMEGLLVAALLQTSALAFNVGLIICMLRLVAVTDLAFGWSTTLSLGTDALQGLTDGLALPWAGWLPQAVPDAGLLEATRFTRLDGTFSGQRDAEIAALSAGWWPFLVACVATYGALPRALAAAAAAALYARERGRSTEGDARLDAVWRRISTPLIESGGEGNDGGVAAIPAAPKRAATRPTGAPLGIRWRGAGSDDDQLTQAARTQLQLTPTGPESAGGADYAEDVALLAALKARPPVGAVVFVDGWEAPDKGTRRFLSQLREALGAGSGVTVLLLGGDGESLDVWRGMLQMLDDPDLLVERAADA